MEVTFDGSGTQWQTLAVLTFVSIVSSIIVRTFPTLGRKHRAMASIELYERLVASVNNPDESESAVIEQARKRAIADAERATREMTKPSKQTVGELAWIIYIYGTNLIIMYYVSFVSNRILSFFIGEAVWVLLVIISVRRKSSHESAKRVDANTKHVKHNGTEAIQQNRENKPCEKFS